jgi:glycosyltransferase involved in cell wall biosynthesis
MRLLLVGDDPFGQGKRLAEDEASRLELGSLVQFAGIRRDVPRLMAASDLFVMTSRWEGLGLVFLEAMAAGVPVVSTDVSAIPEVVLNGKTGRLVPADDPGRFAAGMLEAALNPDLRERWAAAGVERVASAFSLDRMVDETLAIYNEVLAQQGA